MEKKSKAGIVVATVILGVLCVAMIALCIVVYSNGSVDELNGKSGTDKNSDFKETEDDGYSEYSGAGENFELVIIPATPAETEETAEEENTDYLCADSDQRELTEEDVTTLEDLQVEGLPADKGIIQMVINEMYARRGYQFEDQTIQDYFNSKTWYQEIAEKTTDMNAIYESMTDVEKANVEFLQTYVQ